MRALQNKRAWSPRRSRLHHFGGFLWPLDGQGLHLVPVGEMSCSGSRLRRACCCSFALALALLRYLLRGLDRRRPDLGAASVPPRSGIQHASLGLHKLLPNNIFLAMDFDILCDRAGRRRWRRQCIISRKLPGGYRGPRLRSGAGCVIPVSCASARAGWLRLRPRRPSQSAA